MDGNNAPLITAAGGALLFISLLLSWFGDFSAWELFDVVDILLAAIAVLALAVGGSIAAGNAIGVSSTSVLYAGLIALGIVGSGFLEGEERKIGLILALVATIAIIVGAMGLGRGATTRTESRTSATPPPPPPPAGA